MSAERLVSVQRFDEAAAGLWSREVVKRAGAVVITVGGQQIYVVESYAALVRLLTQGRPGFLELRILSIAGAASELFINHPAAVRLYNIDRIAFVRPVVDRAL